MGGLWDGFQGAWRGRGSPNTPDACSAGAWRGRGAKNVEMS